MKIKLIVFLLISISAIKAQGASDQIGEIRESYNQIVNEKSKYKTTEKDITWDYYEVDVECDCYYEKIVTYYHDQEQLKMVVIKTNIALSTWIQEEVTQCYYKNGSIFFIHSQMKSFIIEPDNPVNISEKRIYLDTSQKCIRLLEKEMEGGTRATIDSLIQKVPNTEHNCTGASDFIKEVEILLSKYPAK